MAGDPVEQEKRIKYLNLVANAIMLQKEQCETAMHELFEIGIGGFHPPPTPPDMQVRIRRFGQV